MAGNTKLVGFLSDNRLRLERWGGMATVQLDARAVESLRSACFNQLPQRPPVSGAEHLPDFRAQYDSSVGRVHVDLSPDAASNLAKLLDNLVVSTEWPVDITQPSLVEMVEIVKLLQEAVQAHVDFHTYKDEPGVEDG
jgi:hypothetical protein